MNSRILKFFNLVQLVFHVNYLTIWRIGFNILFFNDNIGIF